MAPPPHAPMTDPEAVTIKGFKVNYGNGEKTPFEFTVKPYPRPGAPDKEILTAGILKSADYIIYNKSSQCSRTSSSID